MFCRLVASGRSPGLLTVSSVPSVSRHLYTTVGAVVTRSRLYSRSNRSCKQEANHSNNIWELLGVKVCLYRYSLHKGCRSLLKPDSRSTVSHLAELLATPSTAHNCPGLCYVLPLTCTISMCSSPKKPHLNPKPMALLTSGSNFSAASFSCSLSRASRRSCRSKATGGQHQAYGRCPSNQQ